MITRRFNETERLIIRYRFSNIYIQEFFYLHNHKEKNIFRVSTSQVTYLNISIFDMAISNVNDYQLINNKYRKYFKQLIKLLNRFK